MQIVIDIKPGATNKDIAAELRMQAGLIEGMDPKAAASRTNTDGVEPHAKTNGAAGKPTTKAKAKEAEETFDLETESEELEVETSPATPSDVIAAFNGIVKAKGREKALELAAKITKKHKVKSLKDLNPEQCSKVLSELGM